MLQRGVGALGFWFLAFFGSAYIALSPGFGRGGSGATTPRARERTVPGCLESEGAGRGSG